MAQLPSRAALAAAPPGQQHQLLLPAVRAAVRHCGVDPNGGLVARLLAHTPAELLDALQDEATWQRLVAAGTAAQEGPGEATGLSQEVGAMALAANPGGSDQGGPALPAPVAAAVRPPPDIAPPGEAAPGAGAPALPAAGRPEALGPVGVAGAAAAGEGACGALPAAARAAALVPVDTGRDMDLEPGAAVGGGAAPAQVGETEK